MNGWSACLRGRISKGGIFVFVFICYGIMNRYPSQITISYPVENYVAEYSARPDVTNDLETVIIESTKTMSMEDVSTGVLEKTNDI